MKQQTKDSKYTMAKPYHRKHVVMAMQYVFGQPLPGLLYEVASFVKPNGEAIGPHAIVLSNSGTYVIVFPGNYVTFTARSEYVNSVVDENTMKEEYAELSAIQILEIEYPGILEQGGKLGIL